MAVFKKDWHGGGFLYVFLHKILNGFRSLKIISLGLSWGSAPAPAPAPKTDRPLDAPGAIASHSQ